MLDKLKSLCLSKFNILSIVLGCFSTLNEFHDFVTGYVSRLYIIALCLFIAIILLAINLWSTSNDEKKEGILEKPSGTEVLVANPINNSIETKGKVSIFAKLIFSGILFTLLMTAGSLYYIKNMGVYYVVVQNGLTQKQASGLSKKLNNVEALKDAGITTRYIQTRGGKYEIILYNGYLTKATADSELAKVKSLNLGFKAYSTGPQYITNYFKKLKYLQVHFTKLNWSN